LSDTPVQTGVGPLLVTMSMGAPDAKLGRANS
jgi:hypothetical protein